MNAEQIFHEAVEISDPQKRSAYLDQACKEDDKLRAAIEALLHADEAAGDFLESPAIEQDATLDTSPLIEGPGTIIGRYQLLALTGEGGMGLVYIAEQKRPVKRRVALKIIKPGMDSKQVIARFEAERQALALLDHPNIAHVFDAGATKAGRPYFVMEYVKGMTITHYCDENKLSIEERLELFRDVCEGLHHAHQKGIIHRDIKPSNILVSVHGERVVPKIIDFGIAKATARSLTDKTIFTYQGQLLGTPEYMSPEQVDLATQDIDTRSDIYSLGIVLYELLAGVLPYESDTFRQAGFAEVQKTIREQEPTPPSTRLTGLGEEAKTIAESRRTQVVTLARCLHRELEWIPLKAMRKDRARRYRSASELADDIKNYLTGVPLIAGPEAASYRVKKFVRKHAGSVATVALVAVAIILGLVVSTTMYFKAEDAHQKEVMARTEAEDAREKESASRVRAEKAEKEAEDKAESYRHLSYNYGVALADSKYREANMGGVRKLLDECPEDLRDWEWQRLNYISDQAIMTLQGHVEGGVYSVRFSPDGKWLASCGYDSTIRIWDVVTGAEMRILRGHADSIWALAISPDGKRIVSGSEDKTVRVWDVVSGRELMILRGHTSKVEAVAFSPDGKRIASGSDDKTIRIWDATDGRELMILRGHNNGIISIEFSPDGRFIASGSRGDKGIKIWHTVTGKYRTLQGDDYSRCVAFSPDGQHIIFGGEDGVVRVLDIADGNELMTLRGHNGVICSVAFSCDGMRIVSCGYDNTIRIWDAETGIEQRVLRGHEACVSSASFSPDGDKIVSSSWDLTIKIWEALTDHTRMVLNGHQDHVTGLAFTPDGKQIVSSGDKTIKIWDATSGAEIQTLHKHEDWVMSVAISHDGRLIASASLDKTIKLWDRASGEELMTFRGHDEPVWAVKFSPDSKRIVSGAEDNTIRIWDIDTGESLMTLRGHKRPVLCVDVSPDGSQIISGSISDIKIWDAATGNGLVTLSGHKSLVWYVAYSPDGKRIVSCSWDKTVKIWDSVTGNEVMTLEGHNDYVTSAAFCQEGKRLISNSINGRILVWDLTSGQELTVITESAGSRTAKLSWDEQTLAIGCLNGRIVLWQSSLPPEGYGPRKLTVEARTVVDQLYSEHSSYHEVIDKLNNNTEISESICKVALQIANARSWEDAEKLAKESWEIISSQNEDTKAYKTALEKVRLAIQFEPDDWSILNTLGVAQYRMGAYKEALKTLTRVERIRTDSGAEADPVNLAFLVMTLDKLNQAEETQITLERLRNIFNKGQYDNDYKILSSLIEAETVLVDDNVDLIKAWENIRLGKIDAAAQIIENLRSSGGTRISAQIEGAVKWLGRAYYQRGSMYLDSDSEYTAKITNFESAIQIDPNHAETLNDLAWLRATCPMSEHRDGKRAVELATKVSELKEWKKHEYISTLAAAYSEIGNFNAAIKWQNKAMDLLPEDCSSNLKANYEARLGVYLSKKPYRKGSLWSLTDGELVAHWKLDEVKGNMILDSTEHGLNGRIIGDAHVVSDPERGSVLSLDGEGDYVDCGNDSAFHITGSITLAAWIKVKTSEDNWQDAITSWSWYIGRDPNEVGFGGVFTGGTSGRVRWIISEGGNIDVEDDRWHHIVGVHDGTKIYTYVDGILEDFGGPGGTIVVEDYRVYIGGTLEEPKKHWNGLIDDVRIYSYALSADEIKMLYKGKEPPREKRSE
ncbi:protein kinase [Planctomycetota bacterium]